MISSLIFKTFGTIMKNGLCASILARDKELIDIYLHSEFGRNLLAIKAPAVVTSMPGFRQAFITRVDFFYGLKYSELQNYERFILVCLI